MAQDHSSSTHLCAGFGGNNHVASKNNYYQKFFYEKRPDKIGTLLLYLNYERPIASSVKFC